MNTNLHQDTEQDIARVLSSLRNANPPAGLEDRIAHRLRSTTSSRPTTRPSFASLLDTVRTHCLSLQPAARNVLAVATLATLLALSISAVRLHHSNSISYNTQPTPVPLPSSAQTAATSAPFTPQPPARQIRRALPTLSTSTCDCDESALAETLAPSHPAPPMPLTPQELRLVLATRPGAPIEVAELDQLRKPFLQAAERAQEHSNLRQYIHGLLAPLATAEALETTSTPAANDSNPPSSTNPIDSNQPY